MHIEDAIRAYCRSLHAAGRSAATERSYSYLLARWGRWLDTRGGTWAAATPAMLDSFIEGYSEDHSRTSTALICTCLRSFYRWATRRGHFPSSPADELRPGQRDRPLPRALPGWQIRQLMDKLDSPPAGLGDDERAEWTRNRRIVRALLYTGVRLAELAGVRPPDVDIDERTMRILGKGGAERLVPLHPDLVGDLAAALASGGPLFPSRRGGPISAAGISEMFRRFVQGQLGVACTAHQLRHSVAVRLLREGVDIRLIGDLLGHQSLNTTKRYTHLNTADLSGAVGRIKGW